MSNLNDINWDEERDTYSPQRSQESETERRYYEGEMRQRRDERQRQEEEMRQRRDERQRYEEEMRQRRDERQRQEEKMRQHNENVYDKSNNSNSIHQQKLNNSNSTSNAIDDSAHLEQLSKHMPLNMVAKLNKYSLDGNTLAILTMRMLHLRKFITLFSTYYDKMSMITLSCACLHLCNVLMYVTQQNSFLFLLFLRTIIFCQFVSFLVMTYGFSITSSESKMKLI